MSISNKMHNIKEGTQRFIESIDNELSLFRGCPVVNGVKFFGMQFEEKIDEWYKICMKNISSSPNTMHKYGSKGALTSCDIDYLLVGLRQFINDYFEDHANSEKTLYLYQQFSVHYSSVTDKKLDEHMDDSDITINICLKNTINDLSTHINFVDTPRTLFSKKSNKSFQVSLKKCEIMIHKGNQIHSVSNLISLNENSERCNIILWLKYR